MEHFTEHEKIKLMECQHEETTMHNHDFLEMVYVTNGSAIHTLNNEKTLVKQNDYFIIDYGAYHKYNAIGDAKFIIINILFKPEFIDKTLFNCLSFRDLINNYLIRFSYKSLEKSPTNIIYSDSDKSIYTLIEKLQNEYGKKNPGYLELMRCYLIEIIIQTMRRISREDTNIIYNDYSKYIVNYVEDNYMKQITLTEISSKLKFSLPYICKRFKSDVGMTFNEYLQKKRIEQSCRLIANTDKKFSEISELVGYSDIKFFNQIFKKYLNMTPREFKKLYNN
jgi:AraC-type DNA-binding domain-containing proteins